MAPDVAGARPSIGASYRIRLKASKVRVTAPAPACTFACVNVEHLPAVNALLNSFATVLLICGYIAIKRRKYRPHGWLMSLAFAVSTLFLVGYIAHKYLLLKGDIVVSREFPNLPRWLRITYYWILFPHLVLAMVMLPMIVTVFLRAWWRQWEKHRRLARWTFPIWLYVSFTGVLIYWMLYHLFPAVNAR